MYYEHEFSSASEFCKTNKSMHHCAKRGHWLDGAINFRIKNCEFVVLRAIRGLFSPLRALRKEV